MPIDSTLSPLSRPEMVSSYIVRVGEDRALRRGIKSKRWCCFGKRRHVLHSASLERLAVAVHLLEFVDRRSLLMRGCKWCPYWWKTLSDVKNEYAVGGIPGRGSERSRFGIDGWTGAPDKTRSRIRDGVLREVNV